MEKKETFRFGVMGAGNISNKFCDAAEKTEEVCVTAVAARSEERAREFAEKYEIHSYYGNYEEMLQKEKLDGVYIGVVTGMHVQLGGGRKNFQAGRRKENFCYGGSMESFSSCK